MPLKNQWKWYEHNVTVASYVPSEIYEALVDEATQKGAASGNYISLSQLIRDILEAHVKGAQND